MRRELLLRSWAPEEDARLTQMVARGKSGRSIAKRLRRSLLAVASRKAHLKITMRPKSQAAGVGAAEGTVVCGSEEAPFRLKRDEGQNGSLVPTSGPPGPD
jgi:hypothetical protein